MVLFCSTYQSKTLHTLVFTEATQLAVSLVDDSGHVNLYTYLYMCVDMVISIRNVPKKQISQIFVNSKQKVSIQYLPIGHPTQNTH